MAYDPGKTQRIYISENVRLARFAVKTVLQLVREKEGKKNQYFDEDLANALQECGDKLEPYSKMYD